MLGHLSRVVSIHVFTDQRVQSIEGEQVFPSGNGLSMVIFVLLGQPLA
jgi:hypothetical protein